VDPSTVVACQAQACAALTAAGFPAAQEVQIGLNSPSLSNASLVVVTPALRTLFETNPSVGYSVTSAVLASFGPVSIQVIDPAGTAAYQAALSADVQARIQVGEQLLNSGRVSASAAATRELAAGEVDSRLLLALRAVSYQQPIDIVGFNDSGPGASQGIPLRLVALAENDPAAGMSQQAYLHSIAQVLTAHATFPAYAKAGPGTLPDGQTVVEIQYASPGSLGLLTS
jgi:hypothetical protein